MLPLVEGSHREFLTIKQCYFLFIEIKPKMRYFVHYDLSVSITRLLRDYIKWRKYVNGVWEKPV